MGGRILKDESLAAAYNRLTLKTFGEKFTIEQSGLLGPNTIFMIIMYLVMSLEIIMCPLHTGYLLSIS
jgi:hypothetical protein